MKFASTVTRASTFARAFSFAVAAGLMAGSPAAALPVSGLVATTAAPQKAEPVRCFGCRRGFYRPAYRGYYRPYYRGYYRPYYYRPGIGIGIGGVGIGIY